METGELKKELLYWIGHIDSFENDSQVVKKIAADLQDWKKIVTQMK